MVVMIAEQMVGLSVKFHGVFNQNKSSFDKIPTGVQTNRSPAEEKEKMVALCPELAHAAYSDVE